jgi:hypothetical protein
LGYVKELIVALKNGATAWGSRGGSEDERSVDVVVIVFTVVLDLLLPVFSKMVDSDAVGFRVDDGKQLSSELHELGMIHFALEDGVLDALAVVEAGFRNLAEPLLSGFGDGGNVVGEEDVHWGFQI